MPDLSPPPKGFAVRVVARRRPVKGAALDPAVIKLVDALARALAREDDSREREAQAVAPARGETNR